jgi:hypothetical protein
LVSDIGLNVNKYWILLIMSGRNAIPKPMEGDIVSTHMFADNILFLYKPWKKKKQERYVAQ